MSCWIAMMGGICALLAGAAPSAAAAAPTETNYEVQRQFDLCRETFDKEQLRLLSGSYLTFLKPTLQGLHVIIPAGKSPSEVAFTPRFSLRGDFEITVAYEIVNVAEPDVGDGVGPCIYLMADTPDNRAASLWWRRQKGGGDVYVAHRAADAANGKRREQWLRSFPTKALAGQLRLQRSGDRLRYLVADDDAAFRLLQEGAFTDAPIKIANITVHRQKSTTPAEVVWKQLTIRAEATGKPFVKAGPPKRDEKAEPVVAKKPAATQAPKADAVGTSAPVEQPSAPPEASPPGLRLAIGVAATVLLLIAVAVSGRYLRRGKADRGQQP